MSLPRSKRPVTFSRPEQTLRKGIPGNTTTNCGVPLAPFDHHHGESAEGTLLRDFGEVALAEAKARLDERRVVEAHRRRVEDADVRHVHLLRDDRGGGVGEHADLVVASQVQHLHHIPRGNLNSAGVAEV